MTPTQTVPSATDAGTALVRRFFACFAQRELAPLRTEILHPDVRWHVPGHHPLAGTLRGPDEVVAFFTQLARSGFRADMLFLRGEGTRVVEVHRGWSTRGDGTDVDLTWVLVFEIDDGRIVEARSFVSDQAAADTFFHRAYPLAPLSQRLADPHSDDAAQGS